MSVDYKRESSELRVRKCEQAFKMTASSAAAEIDYFGDEIYYFSEIWLIYMPGLMWVFFRAAGG